MYIVELQGKLSSENENKEDILTSNVFSFFKYSDREVFLKRYLLSLGLKISTSDSQEAKFLFWPRYDEGTEPDLVLIVGDYYLLIEAKYFSDFSGGKKKDDAQLLREIKGGLADSKNYGKKFKLVTITNDYYFKPDKFKIIPDRHKKYLIPTNWRSITAILEKILEENESSFLENRLFIADLYDLLIKKNLRSYRGFKLMPGMANFNIPEELFFKASSANFRGEFIGFITALAGLNWTPNLKKPVFFQKKTEYFSSVAVINKLKPYKTSIFFKG